MRFIERGDNTGFIIDSHAETSTVLPLLERMDEGYVPTEEEQTYLDSIEALAFSGRNIQACTLPQSIGKLINLRVLALLFTPISTLPECIGNLTNLQELVLIGTQISTLPDSIANLSNLQELYLDCTQISDLPDYIGNLTNLRHLDLSDLHLKQIPHSTFQLGLTFYFQPDYNNKGICLWDTTLSTQPISLFHQPRKLIQAYYDAPKVTINDAKVIFLGDGGVGKSRTIKRLLNGGEPGNYPTKMTPCSFVNDVKPGKGKVFVR